MFTIKGACRVCLENDGDLYLLSDKCNDTVTYLDVFHDCTKLRAQHDEELCSLCAKNLLSFYEFICKARESDAILKKQNFTSTLDDTNATSDVYEKLDEGNDEWAEKYTIRVEAAVDSDLIDVQAGFTSNDQLDNNEIEHVYIDGNSSESIYFPPDDDTGSPLSENMIADHVSIYDPESPISPTPKIIEYSNEEFTQESSEIVTDHVITAELTKKPKTENSVISKITKKGRTNRKAICSICGKVLSSKQNLQRHMSIHNDDDKQKNEKTKSKTRAKPSTEICNICDRVLSNKANLRRHMLIHTGQKDFSCTICPKKFPDKYHLRNHMRYHTDERPYKCEFCKKRFHHVTTLASHKRRHTGERPYSCHICGKRFIQPSNMRHHIKVIHMEKTIMCSHCDRKFARQIDLDVHLRTVSGDRPFLCEFCPNRYIQKRSLIKHLQTNHLDQINQEEA